MPNLNMMTRRHVLTTAATLLLSAPAQSIRAAGARRWHVTGEHVEKLDGLDAAMQRFMQHYGVRGGSCAVARQGRVLFERGYTWADADYPTVQPNSPFRLASISKLFTAALIYELMQARMLETDQKVFPWLGLEHAALPGQHVDPHLKMITVQHLLDHKGGWNVDLSQYDPIFSMHDIGRKLALHRPPSPIDIARYMVGEPLQFSPGQDDHYSNFGYLMLGLVAERAGNGEYFKLMQARVTAPLGINEVFVARTRWDRRLPGEGLYDQPGTGATPEYPDRDVQMPLPYGGEGWLTESMVSCGGLAASAGAIARTIGHYAVWGTGLRRRNEIWARSGSMAGTTSFAMSRPDGLDYCFVFNTRNFGNTKDPDGDITKQINAVLDSYRHT